MKYHLGFLSTLAVVMGALAYLALTFNERDLFYFHGAIEDVTKVLNSFRDSHTPITEINFSQLYGASGTLQVLHPLLDLRPLRFAPSSLTCGAGPDLHQNSELWPTEMEDQAKSESLRRYLYDGGGLPEDFIRTPPFIASDGSTYASILAELGRPPFAERHWVEQHLAYFKVSELKRVLAQFHILDSAYSIIAHFNQAEIEEVIRGTPVIMTNHYLLLKNQTRLGFSPLSYWVYDIRDFYINLKDGKYELIPFSEDAFCLQRVGNLCWTYNSKHALGYLYRYSLALLIGVGLVFFAFLCAYLKYIYEKSREQTKHRLALQVLSHEFRTPVSSMLLIIEQLTRQQGQIPQPEQDLISRMSSEAFRLQRIIEVSKTYLQAESHRIQFKYAEIPSLNAWVGDFVAESNLRIQCEFLSEDRPITADPFWLKFVLSTLIQNAFAHGMEPVCIRLKNQRGKIKISVEDQGECDFGSIQQMSDPFVKSARSRGMGLGLNIAKFIVDEWGSEIRFSKNPTSFTLSLLDRKAEA